MKTYVVQLEEHDDVISTRDKISWSKARRVLLVWPRSGRIFERRMDLLLLQRHSQKLGTQIALVTRSGEIKGYAEELGIPVFASPVKAQHASWRRGRGRRKPVWEDRKLADPKALRATWEAFHAPAVDRRWLRMGMFSLGVLSFLVLVLFFAPGAQVDVKPMRKIQQMTIPVWAGLSIPSANLSGGLPAQALKVVVEGRDQATSSGQARIPDQAAAGQVLLTNLTDQPVDVPENSVVLTVDAQPVRFVVIRAGRIPAGPGKAITVSIQAVDPGSAGNVAKNRIRAMEGPAGLRLAVDNPEPTRGGTERTQTVPSSVDASSLRERLLSSLQANAVEEMQAQVKTGQRLLSGTVRLRSVIEERQDPPTGQPGEQLQLSLRVEYEAWLVSEADLEAVAQAALEANRPSAYQPVPGSLQIQFADQPKLDQAAQSDSPSASDSNSASSLADASGNTGAADPAAADKTAVARWDIKIERSLQGNWSSADVIRAVRGRGTVEAVQILRSRFSLAETPRISIYPAWWMRLPYLPSRITVVKQ